LKAEVRRFDLIAIIRHMTGIFLAPNAFVTAAVISIIHFHERILKAEDFVVGCYHNRRISGRPQAVRNDSVNGYQSCSCFDTSARTGCMIPTNAR